MRAAMLALSDVAGDISPTEIRAETLCAAQEHLVSRGVSRGSINAYIRRIKTALRWAARPPRRWIGALIVAELALVEPLKRHRTPAPESPGVKPVSWEMVSSTIAIASLQVATMIELHWLIGCRPSELVSMRWSEIRECGDVMVYSPTHHKTEHHGRERHIVVGPLGVALLRAWRRRSTAGDRLWTITRSDSYGKAVARLNRKLSIKWNVAQIRHSYLTRIGLSDPDGARAVAGHARISTTEIYIERDIQKAIEIQRQFG